jgi:hypothetical protein
MQLEFRDRIVSVRPPGDAPRLDNAPVRHELDVAARDVPPKHENAPPAVGSIWAGAPPVNSLKRLPSSSAAYTRSGLALMVTSCRIVFDIVIPSASGSTPAR